MAGVKETPDSREITKKKKLLAIDIEAGDVVALRAAANAYLRALQVCEGIEDVRGVRDHQGGGGGGCAGADTGSKRYGQGAGRGGDSQ